WITLHPQPELDAAALRGCLLCRPRAVADAVLNVAMFVPVGMLLATVLRPLPTVAVALALTSAIELLQLLVPGRDPSPGDILFNTLGAAVGLAILRVGHGWLRPGARLGTGLAVGWTALAVGVMFGTGWM